MPVHPENPHTQQVFVPSIWAGAEGSALAPPPGPQMTDVPISPIVNFAARCVVPATPLATSWRSST